MGETQKPRLGCIQGCGVKFFPPGTPLSGQNERSTPVVIQNAGEHISVVWPTNIRNPGPGLPAAEILDLCDWIELSRQRK